MRPRLHGQQLSKKAETLADEADSKMLLASYYLSIIGPDLLLDSKVESTLLVMPEPLSQEVAGAG